MTKEQKLSLLEKLASLSTIIDMLHFAVQNELIKDENIVIGVQIIDDKVKEAKEVIK